jgi:hypothetical protein
VGQEKRDPGYGVVIDGLAQDRSQRVQVGIGQAVRVWIAWPEKLRSPKVFPSAGQLCGLSRVNVNCATAKDGDRYAQRTAHTENEETVKGDQGNLCFSRSLEGLAPALPSVWYSVGNAEVQPLK